MLSYLCLTILLTRVIIWKVGFGAPPATTFLSEAFFFDRRIGSKARLQYLHLGTIIRVEGYEEILDKSEYVSFIKYWRGALATKY